MGYEVDYLAVGDGEKSGDAIAVRAGNLSAPREEQFILVIDGGTNESGERMVKHIHRYYQTDWVNLVLSGHPDADHSSGLEVVLEELGVQHLWMHRPWEHSAEIRGWFSDGRLTNDGLSDKLRRELEEAWTLEKIANRKGIPITEPFSDNEANGQYQGITILGPSTRYYESLLPHFRDMPDVRESTKAGFAGGFRKFLEAAAEVITKTAERWGLETLKDPAEDATSAENNTSAILLLTIGDRRLLFTGDAGAPALTRAADFAQRGGILLDSCVMQQVPHHGSKRNVGPTLLNRIIGPRLGSQPASTKLTVVVSASADGAPKHPAKKVTNAYIRRGAKVLGTQGTSIRIPYDAPNRADYSPANPIPFYTEVEE